MKLAIALLVLLNTSAMAADVYVSPDGSDANTGTCASPKRTVDAAFSVMNGGDTLHIAPGKYDRIRVSKRLAGTVDRRTNILASDGAEINEAQSYGVLIEPGADFFTIDGVRVSRVSGTGIIARECRHYAIRNCVVSDCTESGIDAGSGHVPFDMQGIIEGCTATGNGTTNQHHGIYASHSNVTISRCVASGNAGYGIHVWDNASGIRSALITGCHVFGNKLGAVIVSGDAAGKRCHNIICGNVMSVDSVSASSACVSLWRTNGAVVSGNVMFTSWVTLLELPGTSGTVLVDNCEYPIDCQWNTHDQMPTSAPVIAIPSVTLQERQRHVVRNALVPGAAYRCSFSAKCSVPGKQVRIENPHRLFTTGQSPVQCRTTFVATKADFSLHAVSTGEYLIDIENVVVERAYGPGIEDDVHGELMKSVSSIASEVE